MQEDRYEMITIVTGLDLWKLKRSNSKFGFHFFFRSNLRLDTAIPCFKCFLKIIFFNFLQTRTAIRSFSLLRRLFPEPFLKLRLVVENKKKCRAKSRFGRKVKRFFIWLWRCLWKVESHSTFIKLLLARIKVHSSMIFLRLMIHKAIKQCFTLKYW